MCTLARRKGVADKNTVSVSKKKRSRFLTTQSVLCSEQLFEANIDVLQEGRVMLAALLPEQYIQGYKPAFASTVGAHFRHVLEHYRCFLKHLPRGEICYDSRERDQLLEVDHSYALTTINELCAALEKHKGQLDINTSCEVKDMQSKFPVTSTLERELLFLQAHSTHHYAIIAAMCRMLGAQPADDFGVAIATRDHQRKTTVSAEGESTCAQ